MKAVWNEPPSSRWPGCPWKRLVAKLIARSEIMEEVIRLTERDDKHFLVRVGRDLFDGAAVQEEGWRIEAEPTGNYSISCRSES
jgi:hypothetical protein